MSKRSLDIFVFVLVFLLSVSEAKAYADPGSGALMWQLMSGVLVAVVFRLRSSFGRFFRRKQAIDPEND